MLDGIMLIWFIFTGFSLIFVAWDAFTQTPISKVQALAWLVVTLYTGPVALFMYLLACRNPFAGAHDAFIKAPWKQAFNSEMHCVAGDATGIILAAIVLSFVNLPVGIDVMLEYVAGFAFGLFIFQALIMKDMFGGDYLQAVRRTIFVEWVSMNMVMAGMIPVMVILKHWLPAGENPGNLEFWWIMGIATIAGGVLAYPINAWLVRKNYKHGCMTVKPKATAAMTMDTEQHADMPTMPSAEHKHMQHDKMGMEGHKMDMPRPTTAEIVTWSIATGAVLIISVVLTAQVVPMPLT